MCLSLFIYFEKAGREGGREGERERECMSQGRDRETPRERIPSKLLIGSAEPNVGLELMNHEILT